MDDAVSMQTLHGAIGEIPAVRCLEAAFSSGRLFHAYLLVGRNEGVKLALAGALAKAGNCRETHTPGTFCSTCDSCRHVDAGGSAALRIFGEPGVLDKDAIDRFIACSSIKAPSGGLRVSVFRGADYFTDVAGDRVLKTIEEPLPGNLILLLARNSRRVLPTIRSRVQVLKIDVLTSTTKGNASVPNECDEQIGVLLEFSRENVHLGDAVVKLLHTKQQLSARDNAASSLQAMNLFLNAVVRARAKVAPPEGISTAIEPDLARMNFVLNEARICGLLVALSDHMKHLEQNVNPELVLTTALLELRRLNSHG